MKVDQESLDLYNKYLGDTAIISHVATYGADDPDMDFAPVAESLAVNGEVIMSAKWPDIISDKIEGFKMAVDFFKVKAIFAAISNFEVTDLLANSDLDKG